MESSIITFEQIDFKTSTEEIITKNSIPPKFKNCSYKLDALFIENLHPFKETELIDALRFTHLIDTLYYGDVEIFATSKTDLLDRKFKSKIGRCISRLSEKCMLILE